MSTHTVRRTAAAGLAVVAILCTAGCSRHLGAQPAPTQVGRPGTSAPAGDAAGTVTGTSSTAAPAAGTPSQAAAAATAALTTAIDRADAAASSQTSDLSASAGSSEGDPTQ
jgi:hypothetical protein